MFFLKNPPVRLHMAKLMLEQQGTNGVNVNLSRKIRKRKRSKWVGKTALLGLTAKKKWQRYV